MLLGNEKPKQENPRLVVEFDPAARGFAINQFGQGMPQTELIGALTQYIIKLTMDRMLNEAAQQLQAAQNKIQAAPPGVITNLRG
jgi:hypothetical protein